MNREPMASTPHTAVRLYNYRWLLYELVLRDLRLRYRGSALGFAWTLLNPLLFMAIYTLVFSVYLRIPIAHYPLFLLSGLIPWTWFAAAVQQGTTAILDGRHYVGKTTFPTEVLLAVPVFANAVNFVLSLPVLLLLSVAFKVHVAAAVLALPVLFIIQTAITFALVQLLATFNVFYRDLQQLVLYAVTALFYLTPIFYTVAQVPERFKFMLGWNPFAALIVSYQDIFYYGVFPTASDIGFASLIALLLLLLAQGSFLRYRESFSQYL
jgi:lipopolysaccharide transport system permease protein